ncbi:LysR family transcriptional regulator [Nocardia asteroides]|uniref:LysR family transcriptional regulator n=1 Tax=Nocardia TaxID=1817 RepID=UPI001356DC84|nr:MULTISPECIES: LysR family transcriptional regulator [Nocardia]MBF6208304.1 LysR family transcriptional regulator [Streptomyces gardneri]UAK31266.1 LysR family transcriptional regulator [Nocardia asteroides]
MTFTQLRILQAVARTGSMTRAAEELSTTQSAVSHALRSLENELGIALLVRGNHGVSLTTTGRAVCRRATLILTQAEALKHDAATAREHERGSLRVGVIPSANTRLLPPILRRFTGAHPQVRLIVLEGSDQEVLEWLQTGAADIATLASGIEGTTRSSIEQAAGVLVPAGLTAWPFAVDRMLAVVPGGHELGDCHSVSMAQLARHPFIMSAGGCEPLITSLARAAGANLKCHYRVRDINTILAMVAEGLGVSIAPELSLPAHHTGVHTIPLDPTADRIIFLALPADPRPMAIAFAELASAPIPHPESTELQSTDGVPNGDE